MATELKTQTVDPSQSRAKIDDLVKRSLDLRVELVDAGIRVDAGGLDTVEGLQRCFDEGLHKLSLPVDYGGLSDGTPNFAAEAYLEIATNLAASDGSLAQNYLTTQLVLREIFEAAPLLPKSTLDAIGDAVGNRNVRLVASNSETGSPQPVGAKDVPGGIRVSGVKTFNSNSGGRGIANVGFRREGFDGVFHALIPLDSEGVEMHGDWDNMGQRGTHSQKITYHDVFVPEGWYYSAPTHPLMLPLAFMLHGTLVLGSGMGALDAGLAHLRATNRVVQPRFENSSNDPLMMRKVGIASSRLQAAVAYQRQVCREFEQAVTVEDIKAVMIEAFRLKAISVETGVQVASDVFDLTGARTTANKYRLDRFWRNARTFACHDPLDVLYNWIGAWDLEGRQPDLFAQYKL